MIRINTKFYNIMFYNKGGKLHREDGPAVIHGDFQSWYLNGNHHRIDGPAIIHSDYQKWWLEGIQYNESDYLAKQEHDLTKQEHDHDKIKEMGLS